MHSALLRFQVSLKCSQILLRFQVLLICRSAPLYAFSPWYKVYVLPSPHAWAELIQQVEEKPLDTNRLFWFTSKLLETALCQRHITIPKSAAAWLCGKTYLQCATAISCGYILQLNIHTNITFWISSSFETIYMCRTWPELTDFTDVFWQQPDKLLVLFIETEWKLASML